MMGKMKTKGMKNGGKVMTKGYRNGGRVMTKGGKAGGAKKMTIAQLRAMARKMGYKVSKA
jgi:enoyl-[acyl-carrier-protein] reductase (NADH)|tara:strand:+ start:157 stop:336 length:180 start_codon:yes stop_codon:yes gene_type:complete